MLKFRNIAILVAFCALIALTAAGIPKFAGAQAATADNSQTIKDLNDQIQDHNQKIADLQKEIDQYQAQVDSTSKQANTLQSAVNSLNTTGKKLDSQIQLTQNNIAAAELTIQKLELEIGDKEDQAKDMTNAIAETIRTMDQTDNISMIEVLLTRPDLSTVWSDMESLSSLNDSLSSRVDLLRQVQEDLKGKQDATTEEQQQLASYQSSLSDKKQLVEVNKQEKSTLLTQTKNQESQYKQLLAEKQAAKAQFEQELNQLQSKLQFTLNPNTIPPVGSGVFRWPLDSVRITQYFGNTEFARTAAYNGQGHNGIDIAASIGTPVKAALDGTVIGVNSQVAPMCQYGKWVLIKHANGLTTLYAHLSLVKVNSGDQVTTGQVIGYSGDTGYATGPHLHFTVYASAAVKFEQYTCNSGITLTIPVSAFSGYLNPMDYLQPIP
ncbi:MAG TPA: peptidoglycan DD-metalloendopeptidase family protein [Candidatus Paceibacterota bacterium]|nr:peptidoglycan DD-metalloendopeptidase family protein [Candidatus Paceibacterota bacterium]